MPGERCGTGGHERPAPRVEGGFVDLRPPAGRFSPTAARWWCCPGSIPVGPREGPDKAWHCPLPREDVGLGGGDKSKIVHLFNIHEIQVWGWGWDEKREARRSMTPSNSGFQSNPEEASAPVRSWLSLLCTHPHLARSEPPSIA